MSKKVVKITISAEEAGQKLLAFLQRNLKNPSTGVPLPKSLLHRLVRSGQVRVNSSRSSPFNTLQAGDVVRIPPLDGIDLPQRSCLCEEEKQNEPENSFDNKAPATSFCLTACLQEKYPNLPILAENADYIVFNKPAGLPVHPGSRQPDSLISWVHACAPTGQTFLPTLAHRLDKATSGVLLIAKSYRFLRAVQDGLAGNSGQETKKEYLAWVQGVWGEQSLSRLPQQKAGPSDELHKNTDKELPAKTFNHAYGQNFNELPFNDPNLSERDFSNPNSSGPNYNNPDSSDPDFNKRNGSLPKASSPGWQLLEDWLEKRQGENGSFMERVESVSMPKTRNANEPDVSHAAHALCRVKAIGSNKYATLLRIELLTGRTHQIRVQLASRGHPIIGDRKYGGPACKQGMLLHSFRFCLPNWPNYMPDHMPNQVPDHTPDHTPDQTTELSFECLPNWQAPYEVQSFISCVKCNPKKEVLIIADTPT